MNDMVNMSELSKTEQQEVMDRDTTNIDEAVAKKMGWLTCDIGWHEPWNKQGDIAYHSSLPSFSTDWNATKILIRWMRERGWDYIVDWDDTPDEVLGIEVSKKYLIWAHMMRAKTFDAEIKDDNLPLAACEAFLLIPDKDLEVKGV